MGMGTAGVEDSSVHTSSGACSVYAIELAGHGRDRVVRELYRFGCAVVDQRIPGYLVVPLSPSLLSAVTSLRGVVRVFEAAGTEFARPVTLPESGAGPQVGDFVRVASGPYQHVSGVIQSRVQGTVQVEIVLFGRMMTMTVPVEQVQTIPLPEAWRE